jgi:hypothetical protein
MTDTKLVYLYQDLINFTADKIEKDNDPVMVAACLVKLGMSMYRTVLNEDDYFSMVDTIYEAKDRIMPLQALVPNNEVMH